MTWYALLPIVAVISFGLRLTPFLLGSYLRKFAFLRKLSVMLPICLLVMITAYTMHNVNFKEAPFGLPELGALIGVAITQIAFRTITISMLAGVVLHQLLRIFCSTLCG